MHQPDWLSEKSTNTPNKTWAGFLSSAFICVSKTEQHCKDHLHKKLSQNNVAS